MNASSPIPNLTEKMNAQRDPPISGNVGVEPGVPDFLGLFMDGSHSVQSYVFSIPDLNGENTCRGKNCFSGLRALRSRTKVKGLGRERLNNVQAAQLRSQNRADCYELLALLLALLLHD